MAGVQGDPYSSFVEKLQLPHPLVQRFAVNAIFERLKSGPAHTKWESPVGQEALARCLTSSNAAVIDQTVKEMCNACAEGLVSVERGLQDLQAALDAVNSESVASVVNGIGFLCRIFLQKVQVGAKFMGKSGDLVGLGFHPFVKSFQSRPEDHQHILRQVGIFIGQASPNQRTITLQFLQPFITFIFLQRLSSASHALFARDLHSQLSLLSCQPHGQLLLKMLINYVEFYQTETAEDCEFALAAVKELVDVWQSRSTQRGVHQIQTKDLEELGTQLLHTLVGLCHELLASKLSLYHALVLVKRMIISLRLLNPAASDSVGLDMVSLAHMLAMVDLEQEQLLLLDLGASWLEDIHDRGKSNPYLLWKCSCLTSLTSDSSYWIHDAILIP
ncbi:unnamed protein product [Calypogeia fissa]